MAKIQVDPEMSFSEGMVIVAKTVFDDNGKISDFLVTDQYDIYGNNMDQTYRDPYLLKRITIGQRKKYFNVFCNVINTGEPYHSARMMIAKHHDGIIMSWRTNAEKDTILESRLEAALSVSSVGVVVHDISDHIVEWNRGAASILGYSKEEALGNINIGMVKGDSKKILNDHDLNMVKAGQPIIAFETKRHHKNGKLLTVSLSVMPTFNTDGIVTGYISIFYDITDEKKTKNQLRNLDAIEMITNSGVLILDNDQRVVSWNKGAENILGYTADEIIGNKQSFFSYPELYDTQDNYVDELLINGLSGGGDANIKRHKNGSQVICSFNTSPVRDDDGTLLGSVIVFNDNTEKYKAQERMKLFASVVDQSHVGVIIRNRSGIVMEYSAGASKIFGYDASEVMGSRFEFAVTEKEILLSHDIQYRTNNGEIINHLERDMVKKDGTSIICACSYSPFYNESGEIVSLVSIIQDITQSKEFERRSNEAEKMINNLFAIMDTGVALYKLTDDGNDLQLIMHNASYLSLLGMAEQNIEGMLFTEFTKGDSSHVFDLLTVAKTGVSKNMDIYSSLAKSQASISLFSPFENHVAVLFTDRSETIEAQQALERHKTDLTMLFSSLSSGLSMGHIIRDDDGNVVDLVFDLVNQAYERYDTLSSANITGKSFFDVYSEREREYYDTLVDVASNGAQRKLIRNIEPLNRYLEVNCYSPHNDSFITVVVDLTERIATENRIQKAYQDARDASEMKTTFLANMSHEIRTPLNGVIGFAELGLDEATTPKTRDYFEKIKTSGDSLLTIINGILDISKVESGKMEVESEPFDLQEVFEACEVINSNRAQDKNLVLLFKCDIPDNKLLVGDAAKLRQILLNLLSNSIKFTDWGTVKMTAIGKMLDDRKMKVLFEVKDNGIGMSEEQLDKVFDPFMQADSSTTRKYGGTGLGLPISKELVELMGGKLEVVSQIDLGSIFSFELIFETTEAIENNRKNQLAMTPVFNAEALICEDNAMNQLVICEHLMRLGINTTVVENGKLAVELIQKRMLDNNDFAVIFMDIHMPVMDGIEATTLLRENGCKTPIIALTANVMNSDIEHYLESGMNDYLGKPFTKQHLIDCLMRHITPISYE